MSVTQFPTPKKPVYEIWQYERNNPTNVGHYTDCPDSISADLRKEELQKKFPAHYFTIRKA